MEWRKENLKLDPLSNITVAMRILDITIDINDQVAHEIKSEAFALF